MLLRTPTRVLNYTTVKNFAATQIFFKYVKLILLIHNSKHLKLQFESIKGLPNFT